MRVSCLPVSFFPEMIDGEMSIREWAHMASEVGLDGFDLSSMLIRNHTPLYMRKLRGEIESEGLPLIMMATYPDFTNSDDTQRQRELEYLKHDIAVASYLHAKYLRILAGQAHPETSIGKGIAWVADNFKRAAVTADELGISLVFENHSKPGAWDYVDFSHPTEIFLEIAGRIADTTIGINFDTANTLVYGDDAVEVLGKVLDRVVTIHAADTARKGKLEPVQLGRGIVPFREIFQVLKQNHFEGWICIEEASRTGKSGVKKAFDFIRETWEKA